jgi:Domain of unknown function (DUF1963)
LIGQLKSLFKGLPPPLEAIVFKPIYPPRNDPADRTYFGGYPTLSKQLAWPLNQRTKLPIPFIGQVELSKLPEIAGRDRLPQTGVLHFFGDGYDDRNHAVLFSGDSPEHLVETPPPPNAPDLFKIYPLSDLNWARPAIARPNAYPKWWMEPVACQTHSNNDFEASARAFATIFPPLQAAETLSPFPKPSDGKPPGIWIPDAMFPYVWAYVEAWCNQLLADRSFLHLMKEPQQDPAMAQECRDWIARAQSPGHLTPTTAKDVEEFWNWVRALVKRRNEAIPRASIADYAKRIINRAATPADRAELQAILKRPEVLWRNALQTIPQQADKIVSGELQGKEAQWFLDWLAMLSESGEIQTLNNITRKALEVVTNLLLGYNPEVANAIPSAVIESNRKLHWPRVERRHQMFGHRQALYTLERVGGKLRLGGDQYLKTHHLLMQFASSEGMSWTWGDDGEFLFWITDEDLKQHRFDQVMAMIEGH